MTDDQFVTLFTIAGFGVLLLGFFFVKWMNRTK